MDYTQIFSDKIKNRIAEFCTMTNPHIPLKDLRLGITWHKSKSEAGYDLYNKTEPLTSPDGKPLVLSLEQIITLTIAEKFVTNYGKIQKMINESFLKVAKENNISEGEMRVVLFVKDELSDVEGYIYKSGEPMKPLKLEELINK